MPGPAGPPVYPELAAELARRCLQHRDLAERVGIAPQTVSHIIRGRLRPSVALRQRIAAELGIDEAELFGVAP